MVLVYSNLVQLRRRDSFYPEEEQAENRKRAGHKTGTIVVVSESTEMLLHSIKVGHGSKEQQFGSMLKVLGPMSDK